VAAHARLGRAQYPAVTARNMLTQCLAELGDFPQASALAEEGIRMAEELQQPASLLAGHEGACYLLLRQGRFHDAIPRLERSLARWNTSDVVSGYHRTAGALGYAYAMTERWVEAFPLLEQAVERAQRVERVNERRFLGYLAEAYLHAGRMREAHVTAARPLDVARGRGERGAEAWALRLLGEIAAQQAPPEIEQAAHHYQQALAVAEALGMRPLQAHCHRGLGILSHRTGQQEQARAELSAAIDLDRAMDMTFWLPQAETA
jgi:tetratricopeptide (TPR) repeat protein